MRAIDANLIIRFLTNDDKRQAQAARVAIAGGDIFIATTVLLESGWVLRSVYQLDPTRITASLRGLAGLPGVTVEDPARLAQALDWMDEGMDFADALHLGNADGCQAFLTFDRKLAKVAKERTSVSVQAPQP